ncbi:MAG TPA: hypothetical protein VGH28_16290 [Polyangiaceae bacterium]|jgi:hypothetical protein
MNALEQEYEDNVQRAKNRERARARWVWLGLSTVGVPLYAVAELSRGVTAHALLDLAWTVSPLVSVPVIAVVERYRKSWEDRDVIATTTDRERLYRDAPVLADAPRGRSARWLAALSLVLLVVLYLVRRWRFSADGPFVNMIIVALVLAFIGIGAMTKRVYEAWRSRRNARLQLRWDHWLESADSCKVGTREWTE